MLTNCNAQLPNPHAKEIRELLNNLAIYDNEYQRMSIELRNLQKDLKQSIDNVIYKCSEMRKLDCPSEERLEEFENNVQNIEAITACYNKRIEDMENKRRNVLEEAKNCFSGLDTTKTNLNKFHHRTIDYLKSLAIESNDPLVIGTCERDIDEINKQFAKEVFYIKKCERVLSPFLQLLYDCKSQLNDNYYFSNYDWVPQGKSMQVVNTIAQDIKDTMGITLRKAFASLHIHQPRDKGNFISQYLMTLERNEEIIKEKLERFETI